MILFAQALFWHFYFILYVFFPRTAHRLVGYFEEEAVISYTGYLEQVERNLELNIAAPQIAIDYWKLKNDARLIDVIKVVREDEKGHSIEMMSINAYIKIQKKILNLFWLSA